MKQKPKKTKIRMDVNTGQPYECELCGERFRLKMSLRNHRCSEKVYRARRQENG